jgi:hypothetical protein
MTGPLLRTALLLLALAAGAARPAAAQVPPGGLAPKAATRPAPGAAPAEELRLHAFTLEHQKATEALALVQPLLSPRGTVELQAATNTLVVRDSLSALVKVTAALRSFDHAARPVAFDIQFVRAGRSGVSPEPPAQPVDPQLVARLEQLFRYQGYRSLARARLDTREGEQVVYDIAGGYRVSFKLGIVTYEKRVKLSAFRIARRVGDGPEVELIHTAVNLWRDQPLVLALSRDEGSPTALLVVLTFLPPAGGR